MSKKLGTLVITLIAGALLAYSAMRSLDFISRTLPADRQILAWFGLAALDGGLLGWTIAYLHGSRGWQRSISVLMVILDLVGCIAMFTLDALLVSGETGITAALTSNEIQTAILALSGIIAANIAATIAHHILDPERMKEAAEQDAFDKLDDAILKRISSNADNLAAEVAPTVAADWVQAARTRYLSQLGTGRIPAIDVKSRDVPQHADIAGMVANLIGRQQAQNINPTDTVLVTPPPVNPTPARPGRKQP